MEQIEIVVKMPRHAFDEIKKHDSVLNVYLSHVECMHDAIKNGTLLPKGHGALKDEKDLFAKVSLNYTENSKRPIYETEVRDMIRTTVPVIKADKEGE